MKWFRGRLVLSTISPEKTIELVSKLVDCKGIYIILDYHSASPIAFQLYMKRILQAMSLLMSKYPKIDFVLVSDEQAFTNTLNQIYVWNAGSFEKNTRR